MRGFQRVLKADGEGFEPPVDFRLLQFSRLPPNPCNQLTPQDLSETATDRVALCVALLAQEYPDLATIVERWEALPDATRRAVLAMVDGAGETAPK